MLILPTPTRIYKFAAARSVATACAVCVAFAGLSAYATEPVRTWRELITVSITAPAKPRYLYINQDEEYRAAAVCVDQYSDDAGVTWNDFQIDTQSPPPTIVWSATIGSFLKYSGEITTCLAPDGSLVDTVVHDSIYATAVTSGNAIYGQPAVIQPQILPPDTTAPTTAPSASPAATQPATFESEMTAARVAPDRDSRIEHFRRAIAQRPNDPLNIQLEFRIANLLCFNPDLKARQPTDSEKALAVFEDILARYDHKAYYESDPPGTWDDPQLMLPRSAVLAASILLVPHAATSLATRSDDAAKAAAYLESAMRNLQWTLDHRKQEWAAVPAPVRAKYVESDDEFTRKVRHWEDRTRLAASADPNDRIRLFGHTAMLLAAAAVQLYGQIATAEHPDSFAAAMQHVIAEFPNTPMADAAKNEMGGVQSLSAKKPAAGR